MGLTRPKAPRARSALARSAENKLSVSTSLDSFCTLAARTCPTRGPLGSNTLHPALAHTTHATHHALGIRRMRRCAAHSPSHHFVTTHTFTHNNCEGDSHKIFTSQKIRGPEQDSTRTTWSDAAGGARFLQPPPPARSLRLRQAQAQPRAQARAFLIPSSSVAKVCFSRKCGAS